MAALKKKCLKCQSDILHSFSSETPHPPIFPSVNHVSYNYNWQSFSFLEALK